jgi:RecA-family ATPase
MHGTFKEFDLDELLELIKRSMRVHQSDNEIREEIARAGLVRDAYMRRTVDGLIAQGRQQTRIPDPSNAAAVKAAQAIKFINVSRWGDEEPPRRSWAVLNRILRRQVTLFSGEGAIGKSLLLMQLLCATVLGRDWIGSMPEPGPIIYLAGEEEEDELWKRVDDILKFYGEEYQELDANGFYITSYAGEDMTLARFDRNGNIEPTLRYDRLYEQACDIKPAIVALDTLSDIYGGNENDRVQVSAFVSLLRKIAMDADCAVIVNAHPSLSGSNSGSGLSGSTAWHGKVRGRMYMRAATDDEGGAADPDLRILEFKKNQYGPLGESIPLRYQNGIFAPVPRGGSLDPQVAEQRAEQVFMSLLDRYTREGRNVTDKKGTSYAPAKFANEQEAKALNLNSKALEEAMLRLFRSTKINLVTEGPPSKPRTRLVSV